MKKILIEILIPKFTFQINSSEDQNLDCNHSAMLRVAVVVVFVVAGVLVLLLVLVRVLVLLLVLVLVLVGVVSVGVVVSPFISSTPPMLNSLDFGRLKVGAPQRCTKPCCSGSSQDFR